MPIYNIWKKFRKGDSPMKLLTTRKNESEFCSKNMVIISIWGGNQYLKDNKQADYSLKLYVF